MKKILLAAFTCAAICQMPLQAILPPLWEGVKEIQAILSDERFGKEFDSGELILNIKKTDTGYLIITNHREHPITIIYKPAARPGPQQFDIEFGAATPVSAP